MSRIETVWRFLYFRLIVSCALQNPIGWCGLVTLAAHRNWTGALVAMLAFVTAYAFPNTLLFRQAARDKRVVLDFLGKNAGSVFLRIPSGTLVRHFDFDFLIPSFIRPSRLVDYFLHNRVHVFLVQRGFGPPPAAACAFVSPIAQDAYIFLRDRLDRMSDAIHFRLAHELGHAAGIYQVVAQRNLIGLAPIYLSIFWIFVTSTWTWQLAIWTLAELLAAGLLAGPVFVRWRARQHLNGELVADYMAIRHLEPGSVDRLVESGIATALVHDDRDLSPAQNAERRAILSDQFAKLRRGEMVDIPDVYMRETFNHPWLLVAFLVAHLTYLTTFAAFSPPSPWVAAIIACVLLLGYLAAAFLDAALRLQILARTESLADPVRS